jgi:hypothetical protein
MLVIQYKQNYFAEKNYPISHVSEKEKKLASNVEVGLFINNFPKFSFYKNKFRMDGVVWFKFPIGAESIHTIKKFSFKNGKIISKSDPIVQKSGNNVIINYQVLVDFITPLNYKHFPASDHKLTIILQNKTTSPSELYFVGNTSNFKLSDNLLTGNWKPLKKYVDSGYIKSIADFPSTVFTIDFYNRDLRHFILLYLPLFLIFFLIFASLLTSVTNIEVRFPVVAGVIPILALHSLVIESVSPPGSNITKVDQIYLTLIVLSLVILLFQSYIGLATKKFVGAAPELSKEKEVELKKLNDIVMVLTLIALVVAMTYTTFT